MATHSEEKAIPEVVGAQNNFDTFIYFPRLPIELRLVIWKLSLPNGPKNDGDRVFLVRAHNWTWSTVPNPPQSRILLSTPKMFATNARKTYLYYGIPGESRILKYRRDMIDVGLLETCHESRLVYTERFNNTLPTCEGGVIRFDDQTTIWFDNLSSDEFLPDFKPHHQNADPSKSVQLPNWFCTIKKLAVTSNRENTTYNFQDWPDIKVLLLNFTALTSFRRDMGYFNTEIFRMAPAANIEKLVTELTNWQKSHKNYSVPDISVFQWA